MRRSLQQCVKLGYAPSTATHPRLMANDETTSIPRSSRSFRVAALTGLVLASATSWSSPAAASIAYAYMLATTFEFGGGCQACHTNDAGGLGTVTKPFGKTLMKLGLKANDTDSLEASVILLSTSDEDSDGDTISDFDELSPDGDPNDPAVFPEGATPVPATPPAPTTEPTATTSQPPATTTPPGSTQVPAPAPAPTPDGKQSGGCSVAMLDGAALTNGSRPTAALFGLLGLAWVARRRRAR